MGERPRGWSALGGSGALAEGIRAELARDPDAYAPQTWSMDAVGHCPCCDKDVYRCTTRHTNWDEGFATRDNVVHPRCDASGTPDPKGAEAGCCCVAPNWGPKHKKAAAKRRAKGKKRAGRR